MKQRDIGYYKLRDMLLLQRIPEGERLREPVLVKQLGINRTAIREALARLEAEGFVVKGEVTGYFVPVLTDEDINEILEVRICLERGAIGMICRKGKPDPVVLAPLVEACDEYEMLIKLGYSSAVSEADRRFHEALVTASGNKRLLSVYKKAHLPVLHRSFIGQDKWLEIVNLALSEHRQIIKLMRGGKTSEAQEAISEHLSGRYAFPAKLSVPV